MVEFNPLIKDKINETDAPKEIKDFLVKILRLELLSASAGIKYPYTKDFEAALKELSVKKMVKNHED